MQHPNLTEEKKLWKKGYRLVAGLDEAGRGPLAGPVVAAAVVVKNQRLGIKDLPRVRDSKQLTAIQREKAYKALVKNPALEWGIGVVSEKVIDKINILEATKLAMVKAVENLQKKLEKAELNLPQKPTIVGKRGRIDFLVLDGNFALPADFVGRRRLRRPKAEALAKAGIDSDTLQKSVVKGDQKVFSCAAASILAKVTRDQLMVKRYHRRYPYYRFDVHKGYGTRLHLVRLQKRGPCPIHRRTFGPVRDSLKNTRDFQPLGKTRDFQPLEKTRDFQLAKRRLSC